MAGIKHLFCQGLYRPATGKLKKRDGKLMVPRCWKVNYATNFDVI